MTNPSSPPRKWIKIAPDPDYWQALGRFVERFAVAELGLIVFLTGLIGFRNQTMARAIFSGTRADQAISFIRRALEVAPQTQERMDEIENVLGQMRAITDVRNDVVHLASFTTSDKGRIVSTISRAHVPRTIRERPVNTMMLNAMIDDLAKIGLHLISLSDPRLSFEERVRTVPALASPWLYTPPPEPPKEPKPRKGKGRKK